MVLTERPELQTKQLKDEAAAVSPAGVGVALDYETMEGGGVPYAFSGNTCGLVEIVCESLVPTHTSFSFA